MHLDRSVRLVVSAFVVVGLGLSAAPAPAQDVPSVVNYQARLTDNTPGQAPIDATLSIDFRIYGSPTGSDLLWSESWPSVAVVGGLVNVLLGSGGSPLDTTVFSAPGERYLEVEIDGEILAPRQRMGSVAFAQRSATTSDVAITCADGQVLKYSGGSWGCSDTTTCPIGSSVECYSGAVGTLGVGECAAGSAACNGAGYEMCMGQVVPTLELCNGDDDNCNGATDESFPEQGMGCTAGQGACLAGGQFICSGGSIACDAMPGSPTTETCNDIDDDCDGTPDNNLSGDSFEPNESCGAVTFRGGLGSNQISSNSSATVYPIADNDYYRWNLNETDSSCGCGVFDSDEDYRFHATLTVPAGAGAYQVCVSADTCGGFNCTTVSPGTTNSVFINLDGSCSSTDNYVGYVRVYGAGSPGFDCQPYTLETRFESGLCF